MPFSADDSRHMQRALELALRGEGFVEPNPMVGAVIVRDGQVVGEGWHRRFGDLHAEAEALQVAGERSRGATLYVTLEPCCHFGKRPPCADAVIAAGISRVVAAVQDPFPKVAGGGFERLRQAGLQVEVGLHETEARDLIAPFTHLVTTGRPWVIAKWAMTLDGKIATHTGDSKWISGEESRAIVQRLRARVDAVMVGRGTAAADDPQLTARLPAGATPPRIATRIVLDSQASLRPDSRLVATARETPVLVVAGPEAKASTLADLTSAGCETLQLTAHERRGHIEDLLRELGRRGMTNVLVEGGAQLLGSLFDLERINEVHTFIAPIIVGGDKAPSPVAGSGASFIRECKKLKNLTQQTIGSDVYLSGRL